MKPVRFYPTLILAAVACTADDGPTQPGAPEDFPALAAAQAAVGWSPRAAYPKPGVKASFLATAPNAAGQSIVYMLGGTEDVFGQFESGHKVRAYNVATNSWTTKASTVDVYESNGAVRIGNRIYFSGGTFNRPTDFLHTYSNRLWAYDYAGDRMIRKADMPIFSSGGVSGVINGKLYVLPGTCSNERWPEPGHCSRLDTRRFFRYDPATDRWASRPWSPHRHVHGTAGVIDGKLYVAGGAGVSDLDVYDPATNKWTTLAPVPRRGHNIGAVLGGKLFVIAGLFEAPLQAFEYTPSTNVWRERPTPTLRHDGVVRVTLDGRSHLFAAGHEGGPAFDTPSASELYTR